MSERYAYVCKNCGKKKDEDVTDAPICCKSPMEKIERLPVCNGPNTAEHTRFDDESGPCDDGRSG